MNITLIGSRNIPDPQLFQSILRRRTHRQGEISAMDVFESQSPNPRAGLDVHVYLLSRQLYNLLILSILDHWNRRLGILWVEDRPGEAVTTLVCRTTRLDLMSFHMYQ